MCRWLREDRAHLHVRCSMVAPDRTLPYVSPVRSPPDLNTGLLYIRLSPNPYPPLPGTGPPHPPLPLHSPHASSLTPPSLPTPCLLPSSGTPRSCPSGRRPRPPCLSDSPAIMPTSSPHHLAGPLHPPLTGEDATAFPLHRTHLPTGFSSQAATHSSLPLRP